MRETYPRESDASWTTLPTAMVQMTTERGANNRREGTSRGAWSRTPWRGAPTAVSGRGWGSSRRS